jgi:hypothetical protein
VTGTREVVDSLAAQDRLLIYSPIQPGDLSRVFWDEVADGATIIMSSNLGGLAARLPALERHGRTTVSVLTVGDPELLEFLVGDAVTGAGWSIRPVRPVPGTTLGVHRLERTRTTR